MNKKNPEILILIPHGGYRVPDELENYAVIEKQDLFLEADTGAIELFTFSSKRAVYLHTDISKLFIDLDRHYTALKSGAPGVMSRTTSRNKDIFLPEHFPDEIALSNILKRHYFPFYEAAEKITGTGKIKLVLDCHTVSASAPGSGEPRPLFSLQNRISGRGPSERCAPEDITHSLLDLLKKKFSREKGTVTERFSLNAPLFDSYLMKKFHSMKIPIIRLSLSRALFLNEQHFSFDYLKIDELRLKNLRDRLWECIEETIDLYP